MEHGCTFIPCAAPDSDVNGLNIGHYFLHQIARVGCASHHIASIACYMKSRRIVGLGGCTRSCAHVLAQQLTASNRGACSGRTQGDQSDILYTVHGIAHMQHILAHSACHVGHSCRHPIHSSIRAWQRLVLDSVPGQSLPITDDIRDHELARGGRTYRCANCAGLFQPTQQARNRELLRSCVRKLVEGANTRSGPVQLGL